MKIILCDRDNSRFEVIADSALTLPGRPTFIPDIPEAASWELRPMAAVRISRLGKSVSAKFARRYSDAFTLAARLMPLDASGMPLDGIASLIDFGVTLGEWSALPEDADPEITFGSATATLRGFLQSAADATVAVSRCATIKMGDILLLPLPMKAVEARAGEEITGSTADGTRLLHVRLK